MKNHVKHTASHDHYYAALYAGVVSHSIKCTNSNTWCGTIPAGLPLLIISFGKRVFYCCIHFDKFTNTHNIVNFYKSLVYSLTAMTRINSKNAIAYDAYICTLHIYYFMSVVNKKKKKLSNLACELAISIFQMVVYTTIALQFEFSTK